MGSFGALPRNRLPLFRLGWARAAAELAPTIVAVAQAIVDRANTEFATEPARLWDPGMSGQRLPAILLTPPVEVDAATNRSEIGSRDWFASYPAVVVVGADNLQSAQLAAVEMVEQLTFSLDDERTLDGLVDECRVTDVFAPDLDDSHPSAVLVTQLRVDAGWQERL